MTIVPETSRNANSKAVYTLAIDLEVGRHVWKVECHKLDVMCGKLNVISWTSFGGKAMVRTKSPGNPGRTWSANLRRTESGTSIDDILISPELQDASCESSVGCDETFAISPQIQPGGGFSNSSVAL